MNYKIGDRIELKKQEQQSTLEQTFNDIILVLKSKLSQQEKLKWCESALAILNSWFKEDELKSVRLAKNKLIPVLEKLVEGSNLNNMALFFEYYKKTYCFVLKEILNVL